ncbi:UNVERIFIED_CONTAM: hypothetical protein Sradi_5989800 [Sesamum radiatum]|uniref:Uncharacterized protein n=1 Tax=Sesamum radiatum TaxID=300843 RepID=A0AAW2KII8_SESRA
MGEMTGSQTGEIPTSQGTFWLPASGNIISVIDVETGMIHHRFQGHAEDVRSICWDVCGTYLVSVSEDSARIWSVASGGKCVHQLQSGGNKFASCTFHPAYSQVVAVGSYQNIDFGTQPWETRHGAIKPPRNRTPENYSEQEREGESGRNRAHHLTEKMIGSIQNRMEGNGGMEEMKGKDSARITSKSGSIMEGPDDEDDMKKKLEKEAGGKPVDEDKGLDVNWRSIDETKPSSG